MRLHSSSLWLSLSRPLSSVSVWPLNCFLEAGDFGRGDKGNGMKHSRWLSFCVRQGGVYRAPYIYWERRESRLYSLIPSGQRGWGDAGDIFQTHFKTAVSLISNKTNTKDVKAYSTFSLKVCFCTHRCCTDENVFVSPDLCARSCCFLPSCQSVKSWRVDPNPTLRPDTLLHKPSVLCCLSTWAGCMDYWCLHRANKAHTWQGHTSHTCCIIHLLPATDVLLSIAKVWWGFPLFMPQLSPLPTIHSYHPSSSSSSLSFDFTQRASQLTHMYFWLCSACWSHPCMD